MEESLQQKLEPEYREPALRMAFSLLRRWRCQLQRDDVEGMVGVALVRAAQQFDPNHGAKFESFLFYYVKAELIRAIEDAIAAKKAIEALRDSAPEFELDSGENTKREKDEGPVLPDPDRISAAQPQTPEGKLLMDERAEGVRQAMQRLEEKHRLILELVYFEQEHPQRIKQRLGLTRSGVRRALKLAKRALADELRRLGIEEHPLAE